MERLITCYLMEYSEDWINEPSYIKKEKLARLVATKVLPVSPLPLDIAILVVIGYPENNSFHQRVSLLEASFQEEQRGRHNCHYKHTKDYKLY